MSEKETNVFEIDDSAIRDGAVSCGAKTKGSLEPIRELEREMKKIKKKKKMKKNGEKKRLEDRSFQSRQK